MNGIMKGLAIAALLVTVLGAGVVLYGLETLTPQVELVQVELTPATDVQDVFDRAMEQVQNRTFIGRVLSDTQGLTAEDCVMLRYTVRLSNKGFFPAEWIALVVEPQLGEDSRDVLQLDDGSAHVLGAGKRGDLTAVIVHTGDASDTARTLHIVCYVLGKQIEFDVQAE